MRFNLLFGLLVLIIFSASLFSETNTVVNSQTIMFLLPFGLLVFSLMSMADAAVVNYMRQWFRQNLFYALAPLAVLYILTIGYIALVDQLTIWSAITPLIYLFLPAPVDVVGSSLTSTHQLAQLDRYTCCLFFYRIGVGSQG